MPSVRKPNPKSQQQISNDYVDPYVFPETGESLGFFVKYDLRTNALKLGMLAFNILFFSNE